MNHALWICWSLYFNSVTVAKTAGSLFKQEMNPSSQRGFLSAPCVNTRSLLCDPFSHFPPISFSSSIKGDLLFLLIMRIRSVPSVTHSVPHEEDTLLISGSAWRHRSFSSPLGSVRHRSHSLSCSAHLTQIAVLALIDPNMLCCGESEN